MYECFTHMYVCTICVSGAQISQKRVLYPLELELKLVSSHHVGAGDQPYPQQKQQLSHCSSAKNHD